MHRSAGLGATFLALALCACEDRRDYFEGVYRVLGTQQVQIEGTQRSAAVKDLVRVRAIPGAHDELATDVLSLDCRAVMKMDSARESAWSLSVPSVCPPFEPTTAAGCVVSMSFTEGGGYRTRLEGAPLDLALSGPMQVVCEDKRVLKGHFSLAVSGALWDEASWLPAGPGPLGGVEAAEPALPEERGVREALERLVVGALQGASGDR